MIDCKISKKQFKTYAANFEYADFLRQETRIVVWVLSFDHLRFRIYTVIRNSISLFAMFANTNTTDARIICAICMVILSRA